MDTLATLLLVLAFSGVAGIGLAWAAMTVLFQAMTRHGQLAAVRTTPVRRS